MSKRGLPSEQRPERTRTTSAGRSVNRRVVLKTLAAAGVGALSGAAGYGYLYERHQLEVTHTDLPVSGLPEALAGLRIGLVTDTHCSPTVPAQDIERAVVATMRERPDLIVLGGDYVTWGDRRYVPDSADLLAPLHAPAGVFAVLGNHDDDHDMPAALAAKGFAVLKDARTEVVIRGERVSFVGIRYWTRRADRIAKLFQGSQGTTRILLAHDPLRLKEAADLDVPLVLSGHTHGGQIVLPGLGAIAARKYPVIAGIGHQENTILYVSRGIGTVYLPVRINCPPEVAILTLRRKAGF